MAKKSARSNAFVSPVDPRIHFVLFLVMVLILVVVVGAVMQQQSARARAFLMCPNRNLLSETDIAQKRKGCPAPYKLNLTKDADGCVAVECVKVVQ